MPEEEFKLTQEEINILKEYVADKKAVSRVWRKFNIFILTASGTMIGVFTFLDDITQGIKRWLSHLLTS